MTADAIAQIVASLTPARRKKADATLAAGIALCRAQQDGRTRRYAVAPSASQPGTVHTITGEGCDCTGFARWSRCRHLDAVAIVLDARQQRSVTTTTATAETEQGATAPTRAAGAGAVAYCGCGATLTPEDEGECFSCFIDRISNPVDEAVA